MATKSRGSGEKSGRGNSLCRRNLSPFHSQFLSDLLRSRLVLLMAIALLFVLLDSFPCFAAPPVVSNIPDQTIAEGGSFATISLDYYVWDDYTPDYQMTWTYSGNTELAVTIDGNRVATIGIPSADWNGSESITFTAEDNSGNTDSDAASFTVTAMNDAPVASDDSATVNEDSTSNVIDVLSDDTDVDGDDLTVASVTQPTNGTVTNNGSDVSYTPDANYYGSDTFTYTVSDGNGGTDTATVSITVTSVNDLPLASDDSATTPEDTPVCINVTVNDSDIDGTVDPTTVTIGQQPLNGSVIVNRLTGEVTYTPVANCSGLHTFTYTVRDNSGVTSDEATVSVNVTMVFYTLTMQVSPTIGGVTTPSVGVHDYRTGAVLDVEATAKSGYEFDHWEGDLAGNTDPTSITMASKRTVRAVFSALQPSIGIAKEASVTTATVGDTITYNYVVTNTGDAPLMDISVTDDFLGAVALGATTLGPGESTSGTLSYTVQESDLPWPLVNSVTVVGTSPLGESIEGFSPPISVHLLPAKEPMIGITSTVDRVTARVNHAVTYTYTVTNRGDTTLTNIRVSDDLLGVIKLGETTLLPGESTTKSATYTVQESDLPGPLKNVAVASASDAFGAMAMDQASATVTLEQVDEAEKAIEEALEGRVVISEVAWAGTPSDPWGEWIELQNLGTTPVDLTNWTLRWRQKHLSNPEESRWRVIALSGVLMPGVAAARGLGSQKPPPSVRIVKNDRDDISWWVLCELQEKDEGCYLLERWHDASVSNIAADLIYDTEPPYDVGLSDLGDIIELRNHERQVVDTANAFESEEDGWPAGSVTTSATMERVDLFGPDVPDNWCTNRGIISNGLDPLGGLLLGTPGVTNSVVLTEVGLLSDLQPTECSQGLPVRVGLELPKESKKDAGWPRIVVTDELAGEGRNGVYQSSCSFSGHCDAQTCWLDIDTSGLSPGRYNLWIVCGEGKTLLVPITVVP